MTVKELIEYLKKFDNQNAEINVTVNDLDGNTVQSFWEIELADYTDNEYIEIMVIENHDVAL